MLVGDKLSKKDSGIEYTQNKHKYWERKENDLIVHISKA